MQRHTVLRGFDLATGTGKLRWKLPGANNTDTANSKIYRPPAGAASAELFLEDRALYGVDGIAFLDGALYMNNVVSNNLYRIPVDATGKAGQPVDIWMDQPVKGPDGMRAVKGKLLTAENGNGKIAVISVNGDKASVAVIKEGLKTPTGVEPAGRCDLGGGTWCGQGGLDFDAEVVGRLAAMGTGTDWHADSLQQ